MNKYLKIILILIALIVISRFANFFSASYLDSQFERDSSGFILETRPYHIEAGENAILLIHGFSASPFTTHYLDNTFLKQNVTIHAISIPGHGSSLFDLNELNRTDWILHADKAYKELKKNYSKVYILGYSLGGDLALNVASRNDVDKLIVMNAPIRYEIRNADLFLPFLRVIEGYHTKGFFPGSESKDIADMYVDLKLYRAVPVKSMMEVVTLSKETREVISNISAPSLIIQSEKDTLVDPYSSVFIFSRINNPDKKIVLLSESSHINFSKKDQDIALNEIGKFIKN